MAKAHPKAPQRALEQLQKLACTSILDALDHLGCAPVFMRGVRSLTPGHKLVGRAVTLRFLPVRPDLRPEVRSRQDSAEYRAMELCGPGDVLVIDAMGWPFASVGGDIKFLRRSVAAPRSRGERPARPASPSSPSRG